MKYRQPYTAYNILKSPYVWSAKYIKGPDLIYKTIQLTTLTPYVITKQLTKKKNQTLQIGTNDNHKLLAPDSAWFLFGL